MTLEEAIDIVKCAIGEVEWNYPLDYAEAFEVAIEALEKQIPRKCRIKSTAKLQTFYCPTCEQVIVSRIENEWLAGRLQKYCDSCGQALIWGDYEAPDPDDYCSCGELKEGDTERNLSIYRKEKQGNTEITQ